ncbi:S41 family peptidase [Hellea sp.]|nr:S41 family peptidase [Hellea sp.]MDA8888140.1 S41 family peptidase [Hellea sp.]MDB4844079.1 S41 family peptidase [Hellea sp.]MDC0421897.1 S41 family peptidase [Hellea sp.]MDC0650945.1 S41 family peptidase [Hellea sp.]MDC1061861.1 S41 family peptidase [Hellea sp.]
MKYVFSVFALIFAVFLYTSSSFNKTAIAFDGNTYEDAFEQLDLFADVLARVNNDYVVDINNSKLIGEAINGMLQSLDPHSSYIDPKEYKNLQISTSGEYSGLGMEVTSDEGFVKVISPIDGTPAKKAGIKSGDYIIEINDESIIGLPLSEAVDLMRGKPGQSVKITIARNNDEKIELNLKREIIKRQIVSYSIKEGLAYVRISQFNENAYRELSVAISSLKKEMSSEIPGLILDLRGNPGGLLDQSIKVSSAFLDGGEVVSTKGRKESDNRNYNADIGELLKGVPLVILIDEGSASASEIVAGAIQDRKRGLIVGMKSFGKGSVQTIVPLKGGKDGAIKLTTQRYYTPSGESIQGRGITPDILIDYLPEGSKKANARKEADLPNTLPIETEKTQKETDSIIPVDYPPNGFKIESDYQLKRSMEILKSDTYLNKLNSSS